MKFDNFQIIIIFHFKLGVKLYIYIYIFIIENKRSDPSLILHRNHRALLKLAQMIWIYINNNGC